MRRLYIGRLGHNVRERDVQRFFRSEGPIKEILMKDRFAFVEFDYTQDAESAVRHLNGRELNGDRVLVEFAKGPSRGARDVGRGGGLGRGPSRSGPPGRSQLRNTRGRDRGDSHSGRGVGISYAEKYGPPRNTDFRVIVENLSSRVSWQDLKDLMRQAGEVTFADANRRSRNIGIVDFASHKDMKHAIETLNDYEFHGRRIKVYEDRARRSRTGANGGANIGGSRKDRSRSRSRSRSRTRSQSRSRSRSRQRSVGSRSRSRDRATVSRSRSRSGTPPVRGAPSRSRSVSEERPRQRSRTGSPSLEKSSNRGDGKKHERDLSRSRSRSRSRSHSISPKRDRSRLELSSSSESSSDEEFINNNHKSKPYRGDDEGSPKAPSASRSPSPSLQKQRSFSSNKAGEADAGDQTN